MMLIEEGGRNAALSAERISDLTKKALEKLSRPKKVLILPPDHTRYHSHAGIITRAAYNFFRNSVKAIMPAIGTHQPMSASELHSMFGNLPDSLFRRHEWRSGLKTLGRLPADLVNETFGLEFNMDWPAQVNPILTDEGHDLILSIGQVVPHEIVGMANYNKNIFIGAGGAEAIHKSHYLGAVYGMERIMGRTETPVRALLNYASASFGAELPVIYILTVVAADKNGKPAVRGLFIGDDYECFTKAAELSAEVNIIRLDKKLNRVAVYLPPDKVRSTWLGNKAVYRSRMAIADGGELTVIAPGIDKFGEDSFMDGLIRKYGYYGTEKTVENVEKNPDLRTHLSAAAHLIHSSSEDRFSIRYAAGGLSAPEIKSAGYEPLKLQDALELFDPINNSPGYCLDSRGEEFYLIKNASIGLWQAD